MILIKNIETYCPDYLGKKDLLISFDKILYISSNINIPNKNFPGITIIDGSNFTAIPGLIDLHVHIAGGGGEGGFTTRTPDLTLSNLTLNGITSCIGLLGTDGTTRSMGNLLAKARALEEEGISTYCWTGCYQMPTRTITDSARTDIVLVDKIIGVGEVAVSDHRGSHPLEHDLVHLASECRVGGMLSGKCGVLHIHLGDGKNGLMPVWDLYKSDEIPFDTLLPTHVNRNKLLYNQSIEYAKAGGFVDITTGIRHENDDASNASTLYKEMLSNKINPYNITMSSDSGGSMPIFDENGKLVSLTAGLPSTNIQTIKECLDLGVALEEAILPFTASPAKLLKLKNKGFLKEGFSADIILLDKNKNIHSVISKGKIMVQNYKPIIKGTFEN